MRTTDYEEKMLALLNDTKTYRLISRDPTNRHQRNNNSIVQRLQNLKLIDYRIAASLKTYTATCPRIYGQPKAHKPDLPLRPVVPGMTSPSYNLSKYVGRILQASIDDKYNIRDSYSFCQYINTVTIPPGYVMVSFDVVSLFTNIPKQLVIHDIINTWDTIKPHTEINLCLFLEIVSFCMDSSYFVFRNKYYEQIEGTAMGNPLSPILADLVMGTLLNTVVNKTDVVIPVLRKYVDDLILFIPADKVQQVLDTFNSYHPSIQFTYEQEQEGRIAYLDMTLIRQQDNTIRTEWYMKSIASGRLLNFMSVHPLSQKINTVKNLIDRVNRLSSNWDESMKRKTITRVLETNDYPRSLINRYLNRTHWTPQITNTNTNNVREDNRETIYRSLPYIPTLTPRIIQLLRCEYKSVTVSPRSVNTVNHHYTRIKDPIPTYHNHNVVYRIQCGDCEKCYIGMTGNLLKTRLSGHQSNLNTLENLLQSGLSYTDEAVRALREKTALIAHCIDLGHRFDYSSTQIVDRTFKKNILPILEMIHIHNDCNSINKRTDTERLNTIFTGLLHTINTQITRTINRQDNTNTNPSISTFSQIQNSDRTVDI